MDEDFLRRLRATFRIEAEEHLQAITAGVLALERGPTEAARRAAIEEVFRAAHSLKGAARAVDFAEIESWCQSLEDIFVAWKREAEPPSVEAFDVVHRALAQIAQALGTPAGPAGSSRPPESAAAPGVRDRPPPAGGLATKPARDDTVRIDVVRLSAQLLKAEEMVVARQAAGHQLDELTAIERRLDGWKKRWAAVEHDVRLLGYSSDRPSGTAPSGAMGPLPHVLEFLQWNRDYVHSLDAAIVALCRTVARDSHTVGRLVDDLLEGSKHLLLLPFGTITAPFPKLVRDLCRDQGKEADLILAGEEVELDKRILEAIKAPLVHLLRNAVDHGVEAPAERAQAAKSRRATITLAAERTAGGKVQLRVADDGAGIDLQQVKEIAVQRGLLSATEATHLEDERASRLVFDSELSTSPAVTQVSGRGLGLAIVRESADRLGGTVTVESAPRQGTTFVLTLPATLAVFRGIVIEAAQRPFIVPTVHVERILQVSADDIRTVEGREAIAFGERAVAFVRLADLLGLPTASPAPAQDAARSRTVALAVVVGTEEQRIALGVDVVVDEQEVLVKPLRRPLIRVRNIAGASVLASGRVVPILHVGDLLKSAARTGGTPRPAAPAAAADVRHRSILVAEDSITSRMLMKGVLESAGYRVSTAVDGLDALVKLRGEPFDLLVTDVEMPRLNGFALTEQIRADARLAELPVILVTALATPEDRARGMEAGAHAYIVKSSFDQNDLLAAVQRLI